MWLLNTDSYSLEQFPDDRRLEYAILSHRWESEEVLFEDFRHPTPRVRAGWSKVQKTCQRARSDGLQYAWIDTCSIDKSSSAELSEAINSMYRWYQNAAVCYVYLSDVRTKHAAKDLPSSAWFTRGWTLQELIAPERVEFFSASWRRIGTRETLAHAIQEITGIPYMMLMGRDELEHYSIAQRMSWAAKRETTRTEDRAYSLLGLFSVNMPMLYGEGERAFTRLQEEIMKNSADQSIFAWKLGDGSPDHSDGDRYHYLLAHSPEQFAGCGEIVIYDPDDIPQPYQQTNIGLQISLPARMYAPNVYHTALNCMNERWGRAGGRIGIFLGCSRTTPSMRYVGRRTYNGEDRLTFQQGGDNPPSFYRDLVITLQPLRKHRPALDHYGFCISKFEVHVNSSSFSLGNGVIVVARPDTWSQDRRILTLPTRTHGIAMSFVFPHRSSLRRQVLPFVRLGFDEEFRPWIWVAEPKSYLASLPSEQTTSTRDQIVDGIMSEGGLSHTMPVGRKQLPVTVDRNGLEWIKVRDYLTDDCGNGTRSHDAQSLTCRGSSMWTYSR